MARGCLVTSDLVAQEYSFLNIGCILGPKVQLGRYVMLGTARCLGGDDHVISKPGVPIIFSGRPATKETVIEDDAWIGYGAIIIAGVRIGRGAIIGAGAVVTKDVPAYEIHAGVPARKIGERFTQNIDRVRHDEMLQGTIVTPEYCKPFLK